jgi:RNA polymerase sigma-70 factor (ECF subfamily)
MSTAPTLGQTLGEYTGRPCQDFRTGLASLVPQLRAFTRMLCGDRQEADGLAQASIAAAWRFRRRFRPGSNLKVWVFRIAHDQFYAATRQAAGRGAFDRDAAEVVADYASEPLWPREHSETLRALRRLHDPLREALLLVGPAGFSYEETARICGCPADTAKRRVSRAGRMLVAILDGRPPGEDHRRSAEWGA